MAEGDNDKKKAEKEYWDWLIAKYHSNKELVEKWNNDKLSKNDS